MDTERAKLIWLRQILTERCSEQDLRTLCFDLGMSYDDLPCEGRASKARELVEYLANRKRISELLEIGKGVRPDIGWDDVPEGLSPSSQAPSLNQLQPWVVSLPDKPRVRVVFGLFVMFVVLLVISTANLGVPTVRKLVSRLLSSPAPTEAAILVPTFTTAPASARTPSPTPMGKSSSPMLECTPMGGATEPAVCVASVSVQINQDAPRSVACQEHMNLKAGDTLRLVNLRYCTSREALADQVAGEAYLYHRDENNNVWTANENVLGTLSTSGISGGCGAVGDLMGSWDVESGQNRVVIALVHYSAADSYEVDGRFFFSVDVVPSDN